ncbi:secreted RxLR effector protein 161-like [Mercurialis annua]|uniref:secreted RxLR effector protein 161-like n=1 Tax=Mercurialis annua TaxID=3986 RepID=UPI002160AC5D|nr:secreted RxLR effector protein 161-like [Mercurialis annua]
MDVKTAFLIGELEVEIYMTQLEGCVVSKQKNKKFGHFDVTPVNTPYDANTQLMKNRGDHMAQTEYAQVIGSLMRLMNFSRPHIAYAVCRLSRYTHNPNRDHWNSIVRLMKYLRGPMNYGILYSGFSAVLEGYSDAN